ncbi:MAG TPA: glycosyltransferase family 4 protein [Tepidisphaeraceae bacterium]|nr:glycosyltransferase family 4 protein [Tepidisphaeraceae bacterium]
MNEQKPRSTSVKSFALVGSYVPRQCGIATFSKDLRDSIAEQLGDRQTTVLAIDDNIGGYPYPDEVRLQIPQHRQVEYTTAAELLNINDVDVALIQHEFGLFGGRDGSHVLDLVRRLRMPVMSTLHTVLAEPSPGQHRVLRELANESDRVIVMSELARGMLKNIYEVSDDKIAVIPHGIPDMPFVDPHFYSDQFGVEGKRVLLTFGLLSPSKGIEVAIKALPRVVSAHPDVVYIVLGATHPHLLRSQGNAYRNSLEAMVKDLGLEQNVRFHNRFATLDELSRYLGVADIYLTPYPNKAQITSGTLAYALGAGKVVVSTPYWHAEEMLADGRGRLFPFGDSEKLADIIIELLDNETQRHAIRKRAYLYSRPMIWKSVGRAYVSLAERVLRDRRRSPRPITQSRVETIDLTSLPDLNLAHMRRLTDDTGMLQHAVYAVPHREHGYCTDDIARALLTAHMYHDLTQDDSVLPMIDTYLAFIHHAFNPTAKRFRNFMSYDRKWLEEVGSEDGHGRAIWGLGTAAMLTHNDAVLALSTRLYQESLEHLETFTSPRAWAFTLIGINNYLARFNGDSPSRRIRKTLSERLFAQFRGNSDANWPWCEDKVTYDNAKLPHALLLTGHNIGDSEMLEQGFRSLKWLVNLQTVEDGRISLIGNNGWLDRGGKRARFDQQPIEAMALVEACAAAYRISGEEWWFDQARNVLAWFTGNNETHSTLYDYHTGGCRDGMKVDGPNLNEGAESTLAWLVSLMVVMDLNRSRSLDAEQAVKEKNDGGKVLVE